MVQSVDPPSIICQGVVCQPYDRGSDRHADISTALLLWESADAKELATVPKLCTMR